MRRLLLLLTALAVLAPSGVALGAPTQEAQTQVVGGSQGLTSQIPYQVALLDARSIAKSGGTWGAFFCGGVILDQTHVITAAHCAERAQQSYAGTVNVLAGTDALTRSSVTTMPGVPLSRAAGAVQIHPDYDTGTQINDIAVLTLTSPLSYSARVRNATLSAVQPLESPAPFTILRVSGWGDTQQAQTCPTAPVGAAPTTYPCPLQQANVVAVAKPECNGDYFNGLVTSSTLCAASPGKDACQGDSGGPLVDPGQLATDWADDTLVGIVSGGIGCADPAFPGLYTDLSAPSIRAFLDDRTAPSAYGTHPGAAVVAPAPKAGAATACVSAGLAEGTAPAVFAFSLGTEVVQISGANTFVPQARDVGAALSCKVVAVGPGGSYAVTSFPQTIGSADPSPIPEPRTGTTIATPPPITTPTPPDGDSGTDKTTPTAKDRLAPRARLSAMRCTRTRCTLTLAVTDPKPSAGLSRVDVRVLSRTGKVARTVRVTARAGRWQVVLTRPRTGRLSLRLVAVDKANNRQGIATAVALRAPTR